MNLSNVLRWVSFFICLSILYACTNTKEEIPPVLSFYLPQSVCYEGDSLSFQLRANGEPATADSWTTTLGGIDNIGRWIAPYHIDADTVLATIVASYKNQQNILTIRITKKAFQQPAISYAQTIQPLLTNNCNFSGCHANGSHAGKVELSVYDSVKTSVMPYNADASKLYFSLIKTDPLRVMPPAGKLHADKIQSVWLWIEQGAKNN
ncbi:MAG: c-type cytochrome domain-containing protein [Bacteroidota bacterium]